MRGLSRARSVDSSEPRAKEALPVPVRSAASAVELVDPAGRKASWLCACLGAHPLLTLYILHHPSTPMQRQRDSYTFDHPPRSPATPRQDAPGLLRLAGSVPGASIAESGADPVESRPIGCCFASGSTWIGGNPSRVDRCVVFWERFFGSIWKVSGAASFGDGIDHDV